MTNLEPKKDIRQLQEDVDCVICATNMLNKKYSRVIKIYTLMAALFLVSLIFHLVRVYQANMAYDQAQESLVKYEDGVRKVEELVTLMQERNKMLAKQDSILAKQDNIYGKD